MSELEKLLQLIVGANNTDVNRLLSNVRDPADDTSMPRALDLDSIRPYNYNQELEGTTSTGHGQYQYISAEPSTSTGGLDTQTDLEISDGCPIELQHFRFIPF